MKLTTWIIERLRPMYPSTFLSKINEILISTNTDFLILTETNRFIDLDFINHTYHYADLTDSMYYTGEVRSSIYSKHPSLGRISTFNEETAICEVLGTRNGNIALYATIIGIYENRHTNFKTDLELQIQDYKRIGSQHPIVIAGDFNISFGDN